MSRLVFGIRFALMNELSFLERLSFGIRLEGDGTVTAVDGCLGNPLMQGFSIVMALNLFSRFGSTFRGNGGGGITGTTG